MTQRNVISAVTLVALAALLGGMALWGFQAATKPLPSRTSTSGEPTCAPEERDTQTHVSRKQIQVSVYNASGKGGLANEVLADLESMNFRPGEAGNAPTGTSVLVAEVWTTKPNDAAAQLVALAMGNGVRVVQQAEPYGPGVDVVVGRGFRKVNRKAPRTMQLPEPIVTCIDVN